MHCPHPEFQAIISWVKSALASQHPNKHLSWAVHGFLSSRDNKNTQMSGMLGTR